MLGGNAPTNHVPSMSYDEFAMQALALTNAIHRVQPHAPGPLTLNQEGCRAMMGELDVWDMKNPHYRDQEAA